MGFLATSRCCQGCVPFWSLWEKIHPLPFSVSGLPAVLGLWRFSPSSKTGTVPPLPSSVSTASSHSLSSAPLPLLRTLAVTLGPPENPGYLPMLRSPDQQTYLILSVTQGFPPSPTWHSCTDSGNKTQTALKGCISASRSHLRGRPSLSRFTLSFRVPDMAWERGAFPPETERLCTEVNTTVSQVSPLTPVHTVLEADCNLVTCIFKASRRKNVFPLVCISLSCVQLCNPENYISCQGSSVHGVSQARIMEGRILLQGIFTTQD